MAVVSLYMHAIYTYIPPHDSFNMFQKFKINGVRSFWYLCAMLRASVVKLAKLGHNKVFWIVYCMTLTNNFQWILIHNVYPVNIPASMSSTQIMCQATTWANLWLKFETIFLQILIILLISCVNMNILPPFLLYSTAPSLSLSNSFGGDPLLT